MEKQAAKTAMQAKAPKNGLIEFAIVYKIPPAALPGMRTFPAMPTRGAKNENGINKSPANPCEI